MYPASQIRNFYPSMLRNLSVLRDIHRIITEARALNQRVMTFRDENGQTWQLVRVGEQLQSRYSPPSVRVASKPVDNRNFNYGYGAGDKDCLK